MNIKVESGVPKKIRNTDVSIRLEFALSNIASSETIPSFAYLEEWENIPPRFIEEICAEVPGARERMVFAMVERADTMPKWRFLNDVENSFASAPEEVRKAVLERFANLTVKTIEEMNGFPNPANIAEKLGVDIYAYRNMQNKPGAKERIDEAVKIKKEDVRAQKEALGYYLGPRIDIGEMKGLLRQKMSGRFNGDGKGFPKAKAEKQLA